MFLEWENPPPDAYSNEGYRLFINNFHEKITSVGTGVTHMSEISGQFDLVSGSMPVAVVNQLVSGLPLYYKFESVGNKTLYLIISFNIYYQTNASHTRAIFGYTGISDRLIDGKPVLYKYNDTYGDSSVSFKCESYNTGHFFHTPANSSFRYGNGTSFISSRNGTLVIQYSMGIINEHPFDTKKSIVSIILQSKPDSFLSIGLYNIPSIILYNNINPTDYGASYYIPHSYRAAMIVSCGLSNHTKNYVRSLSLQPHTNIVPVYTIDSDSDFVNMDDVYYYDSFNNKGGGIIDVGTEKFWLSSDLFEGLSITSSTTNVYSFAVRVV